ncbi:MAG TPA: hypothetical protein VFP61_15235 [Acidimicrobiales bacterium]|nr:hypothetical protein [Acidimicrobiales bacterium]
MAAATGDQLARRVLDLTDRDPRYVTALGDRREVPVACWACRRPTWALDATCDTCHEALTEAAGRSGGHQAAPEGAAARVA